MTRRLFILEHWTIASKLFGCNDRASEAKRPMFHRDAQFVFKTFHDLQLAHGSVQVLPNLTMYSPWYPFALRLEHEEYEKTCQIASARQGQSHRPMPICAVRRHPRQRGQGMEGVVLS